MKVRVSCVVFLLSVLGYILCLVRLPGSILTAILGLPLYFWLCTLVHELAHLTAYALVGLPRKRFRFSVFSLSWEEKGVQFRVDLSQKFFQGECVCAYVEDAPMWKYTIALLSGGVFCGILGITAFLLLPFFPGSYPLWSIGIIFSLNALVNLLPPFSADLKMHKTIITNKRNNIV